MDYVEHTQLLSIAERIKFVENWNLGDNLMKFESVELTEKILAQRSWKLFKILKLT